MENGRMERLEMMTSLSYRKDVYEINVNIFFIERCPCGIEPPVNPC